MQKLTDSDRKQIAGLYKRGAKQVDIAAQFGVSQPLISNVIRAAGVAQPLGARNFKIAPKGVRLARKLRAKGLTHREIGQRLGVSDGWSRPITLGTSRIGVK